MASSIFSPAAAPAFGNYSFFGRIFHWIIDFLSFGWVKNLFNKKTVASNCSANKVVAKQSHPTPVELPALHIPALLITLPQGNGLPLDDAPKTCPSRPAYKKQFFSEYSFGFARDDGDFKQWSTEGGFSIYEDMPKSLPVHGSGVSPWLRVGGAGGADDVNCTNEAKTGSALAVVDSQIESLTPNTGADFVPSI